MRKYRFIGFVFLPLLFLVFTSPTWVLHLKSQSVSQADGEKPLEGRALENIAAFVQLLGYMRYFHPSDAVVNTDWDTFAVQYIESVASASDSAALAAQLTALFLPYAPTLRIYTTGETPDLPDMSQPDSVTALMMWAYMPRGYDHPIQKTPLIIPLKDGNIPDTYTSHDFLDGEINATIQVIHPEDLFNAALPGGVSLTMPLTLYADANGTLPYTEAPALPALTGADIAYGSRASRLAAIGNIWCLFQHFHPYWAELPDLDWQAALMDALSEAAVAQDVHTFMVALRRMAAKINDAHLAIVLPDDFFGSEALEQRAIQWEVVEGQLVITNEIFRSSDPVSPGDIVVSINGRPALDVVNDYHQLQGSKLQNGEMRALAEIQARVGDQPLKLEIMPYQTTEIKTITIASLARTTPDIYRAGLPSLPIFGEFMRDDDGTGSNIFYVDLNRLTGNELGAVGEVLKNAEGIVFDMRGYPDWEAMQILGYLSDEPVMTPPFFWPLVTLPDHVDMAYVDLTHTFSLPRKPRLTDNVAFIMGWQAGSRAEMFLGMVEGYQLGALVGMPTAGINGEVVAATLSGHLNIRWTGMRVTKYDGTPLYGVGITPTVPVSRTIAGVAARRDELLEAAYRVVTGEQIKSPSVTSIDLSTIEISP